MVKFAPLNCWNVTPAFVAGVGVGGGVGVDGGVGVAAWVGVGVGCVVSCVVAVDVVGLLPQAEKNAARRMMPMVYMNCRARIGFMLSAPLNSI